MPLKLCEISWNSIPNLIWRLNFKSCKGVPRMTSCLELIRPHSWGNTFLRILPEAHISQGLSTLPGGRKLFSSSVWSPRITLPISFWWLFSWLNVVFCWECQVRSQPESRWPLCRSLMLSVFAAPFSVAPYSAGSIYLLDLLAPSTQWDLQALDSAYSQSAVAIVGLPFTVILLQEDTVQFCLLFNVWKLDFLVG